jgi:hypothetical protein
LLLLMAKVADDGSGGDRWAVECSEKRTKRKGNRAKPRYRAWKELEGVEGNRSCKRTKPNAQKTLKDRGSSDCE